MAEKIRPRVRKDLSECIRQPISPTQEGIWINERHFKSAVCVVGDGPGLEALNVAAKKPDAAVFIIDPFARKFAGSVYGQLAQPDFAGLDWSFFTGDPTLSDVYDVFSVALARRPKTVEAIERAYAGHRKTIKEASERIFLVNAAKEKVGAREPVFDEIRITYPEPCDAMAAELPPLMAFLNEHLRQGGKVKVTTDILPYYESLLKFAYPWITQHGWYARSGQAGTIRNPQSLYDITNGHAGYHYVYMEKGEKPFPEMGTSEYLLRDALYSLALVGLARMSFGSKKKDLREKTKK